MEEGSEQGRLDGKGLDVGNSSEILVKKLAGFSAKNPARSRHQNGPERIILVPETEERVISRAENRRSVLDRGFLTSGFSTPTSGSPSRASSSSVKRKLKFNMDREEEEEPSFKKKRIYFEPKNISGAREKLPETIVRPDEPGDGKDLSPPPVVSPKRRKSIVLWEVCERASRNSFSGFDLDEFLQDEVEPKPDQVIANPQVIILYGFFLVVYRLQGR